MYTPLKSLLVRLLRAPSEPPEHPPGSYASVHVFRASPRWVTWKLWRTYLAALLGLAGWTIAFGAALAAREWVGVVLLSLSGVPLLGGLFLAWFGVRIDYDLRYYVLTDRSLRLREGWWTVREKTITFANVQNLRVVQGPLQRLFGIQDLRIDTAGGGGARSGKGKQERGMHEVDVAGVENAAEIRDLVLAFLRRSRDAGGLGDPDDEPRRESRPSDRAPAPAALRAALAAVVGEARALRLAAERGSADEGARDG